MVERLGGLVTSPALIPSHSSGLVDIPEAKHTLATISSNGTGAVKIILEVLPVREIQEGCGVQIPTFQTTLHLRLDLVALLVLPSEKQAECGDEAGFNQMRDNHGPNTKLVVWPLPNSVSICPRERANSRVGVFSAYACSER